MSIKEAAFWVLLTLLGTGLYFVFEDGSELRLLGAAALLVIGLAGIIYVVYEHHNPDARLPLAIWVWLLLIFTWLFLGFVIYENHFRPSIQIKIGVPLPPVPTIVVTPQPTAPLPSEQKGTAKTAPPFPPYSKSNTSLGQNTIALAGKLRDFADDCARRIGEAQAKVGQPGVTIAQTPSRMLQVCLTQYAEQFKDDAILARDAVVFRSSIHELSNASVPFDHPANTEDLKAVAKELERLAVMRIENRPVGAN